MDVDSQEDLGAMEAESAAQSIQNEGKSMVDNEARTAECEGGLQTGPIKVEEVFGGTVIQICPGLNANEIQIPYDKHHIVFSLAESTKTRTILSNNPAKYEVLIKQYLRSILDVSTVILRE